MGEHDNEMQLSWTCCNDEQSLFILFYIAFTSISLITLKTYIAKPMRLISTFIHEMSHAVACWLSGGSVNAIKVFHNEGGVTQYSGGLRWLIIPAGYVGCGFWAMIFVILSGGRRTATFAAAVFTVALLAALCYSPNRTMVYLNLGYAILMMTFILIEWFVYSPLLQFIILFFGVFGGINAISDIHSDTIMRSVEGSDSYACYTEVCPCCLPRCIGLQWIALAICFQILGIWIALVEMSNECYDLRWLECLQVAADLDLDWDGFEMFGDFKGFWDNGP
jgi:hypothetical protein